jgi:hypothetical protein
LASGHLSGETVNVVARGYTLPNRVVHGTISGYIILTAAELTLIGTGVIDVEVGLQLCA